MTDGGFSQAIPARKPACCACRRPAVRPRLCAAIAVYSPFKHWGIGAVTTAGIGGLGRVAIRTARAIGAHVVAFTTSAAKADNAKRRGA
ncbi:hypothetical protein [Poseidonocella sp. HB161398]|uniref:hypothetical protein n=1 Tax=Poseidonocella sp. HB161398 TaxID=2320855 RepID=UPI001980120D|nr:hypothetical protein [Poseidonocella sp. HB161398]